MRLIITFLIVLGIVAAFAAVLMVGSLRAGLGASANSQVEAEDIEIMVAAKDLQAMTIIDADSVSLMRVPADKVPKGATTSTVQVVGQVLISPRLRGQPLLLDHLASENEGLHLATTLPEGGRALSIVLKDNSGAAELLYPGCRVDVLATFRVPSGRGAPAGEVVSVTLLQNIRVLAVGGRSIVNGKASGASRTTNIASGQSRYIVTLLVNPAQAEALQLAIGHGAVSLALRNPLDNLTTMDTGVFLSEVSEKLSRRLAKLDESNLPKTAFAALVTELTDSDGNEANDSAASGENQSAETGDDDEPVAAPEGIEAKPTWDVVIIRGTTVETKSFPINPPESSDSHEK